MVLAGCNGVEIGAVVKFEAETEFWAEMDSYTGIWDQITVDYA